MPSSCKNKRIVHITSSLKIGGAERFVIDLCAEQLSQHIHASILSFGEQTDELLDIALKQKIPVTTVKGHTFSKLKTMFSAIVSADIVHIHSPHPLRPLIPLMPILRKKQIIYTRHGARPLSQHKWTTIHKRIRPLINFATFVSQEGMDNFQKTHGWQSTPAYVIDNGVNLSQISDKLSSSEDDKLRLGSVGRMVSLKHQISLLQAVQMLTSEQRQKLEVHFYGDGPCADELKTFHQQNLPDVTVLFHGMVSDREQIYTSFDALVVTSETEGLSMVIIEAMAYQKPVIASKVGGNPKLVEHNKTGLLFDYDDTSTLKDHILTLLNEPKLIDQFGRIGRSRIQSDFSLKTAAKKYAKLYSNAK